MKTKKGGLSLRSFAVVIALALLLSPTWVGAVALTLQNLIDLGATGTIINDKRFYNFTYTPTGDGTPPASAIAFTPLTANPLDPGFRLNSGWSAGSGAFQDSFITYNVELLKGAPPLHDISASIVGGASGTGVVSLDESIFRGVDDSGTLLATLHLDQTIKSGEVIFAPETGPIFFVEKDFEVNGGRDGVASLSSVTNRMSELPEPATMLLFGSGLVGLAGYARKRFKK